MRQVAVLVPERRLQDARRLVEEHGGFEPKSWGVRRGGEPGWSELRVELPNNRVGAFIHAVSDAIDEAEFLLLPRGVLPLRPPLTDVRDQVADVSSRSTLELVLSSLQSIGSWRGMLLYAAVSGLVAAYGVLFDTPYLLTAAMLIAPMGAPIMVAVVGVTVGDAWMVRRGSLRFFIALAITSAVAALLGLAYGLELSTQTMEDITNLSDWTALLAVAGGAAGAQALVRSDRDSLVTATATGFLVAVSLSPPAAVLGLALAIGRGDYVALMAFTLILTYFGIIAGGWASLRFFGADPSESTERSRPALRVALVGAAVVAVVGLVAWQTRQEPRFQKADLSRTAVQVVHEVVAGVAGSRLVQADATFTREDADWHAGEGLLIRAVVQRTGEDDGIESRARAAIDRAIRERIPGVEPFIDVVVLP